MNELERNGECVPNNTTRCSSCNDENTNDSNWVWNHRPPYCIKCTKATLIPLMIRQMIGGFVAYGEDDIGESIKGDSHNLLKCSICEDTIVGDFESNPSPVMSSNQKCCKECYSKIVEPTRVQRFFTTES